VRGTIWRPVLETGQQADGASLAEQAAGPLTWPVTARCRNLNPSLTALPQHLTQPPSPAAGGCPSTMRALRHGLNGCSFSCWRSGRPDRCCMRLATSLPHLQGKYRVSGFFRSLRSRCCGASAAAAFSSPAGESRSRLVASLPMTDRPRTSAYSWLATDTDLLRNSDPCNPAAPLVDRRRHASPTCLLRPGRC